MPRRAAWQAWGVIVGIGVDLVDIARLEQALRRTPALAARLFTEGERNAPPASLAACFAAKEAVAKALGAPPGLRWADVEVGHDPAGRPALSVRGTVADAARRLGVRRNACSRRAMPTRSTPMPTITPPACHAARHGGPPSAPSAAGPPAAQPPARRGWP